MSAPRQSRLVHGALARMLGASALPYGYTLTIWGSGAILIHYRGSPLVWQVIVYAFGAVLAYGLLGALGRPGASPKSPPAAPSERVGAGVLHWLAVGVALGSVILVGQIDSWVAWPLGSFIATSIFLVLGSVELALASEAEG